MLKQLIMASMVLVVSSVFASEEATQMSNVQSANSSQFKELELTENTVKLQIDIPKEIQRSYASQGMYILYAQAKTAKVHGKPYSVMLWSKRISPQITEVLMAFSETKNLSFMQRAKYTLYNTNNPLMVINTDEVLNSLAKVFEINETQTTEQSNTSKGEQPLVNQ